MRFITMEIVQIKHVKFLRGDVSTLVDMSCGMLTNQMKYKYDIKVVFYNFHKSIKQIKSKLVPLTPDYIVNPRIIVPLTPARDFDSRDIEKDVVKYVEKFAEKGVEGGLVNNILHYAKYFKRFSFSGSNKIYNLLCKFQSTKILLRWYYASYLKFKDISKMPRFGFINEKFNPFAVASMEELVENNISDVPPLEGLKI